MVAPEQIELAALSVFCEIGAFTVTATEAVELEPPHPLAVTLTVAMPEKELLQVTTPLLEIDPAAVGVRLQE